MAAYSLDSLLQRWSLGQLTSEQAIGQILQVLQDLEPRVKRLERAAPSASTRRSSAASPDAPPDNQR